MGRYFIVFIFLTINLNSFCKKSFFLNDTAVIGSLSQNELHILDSIFYVFNQGEINEKDLLFNLCFLDLSISENYCNLFISEIDTSYYLNNETNKKLGKVFSHLAFFYRKINLHDKCIENYRKATYYLLKSKSEKDIASNYNQLGGVYSDIGKYSNSIYCFNEALRIYRQINDSAEIARELNNIASIYDTQGELEKALNLYYESLNYYKNLNDTGGQAMLYNNIAYINLLQHDTIKSLENFYISLKLRIKANDTYGQSITLNNIGFIYRKQKKYKEALECFNEALKISESNNYLDEVVNSKLTKAKLYLALNNLIESEKNAKEAFELAKVLNTPYEIKNTSELLYELELTKNNSCNALEYYKTYIIMRDSLVNDENKRAVFEQELKYNFEKKSWELDKELERKELIAEQEKKKREVIIAAVGFGLILVIGFLFFVYNRLRITRKQKNVIQEQKRLVDNQREKLEEKNNQITDSITYARKIQKAVIPTEDQIKACFLDAFVFYKPKDIVSGDFYWLQRVGDKILISVADCTGHGVPGAFMSMIGTSLLDKAVLELGITSPDKILNQLNKDLHERLHVSERSDVKDGMDLFVISLDVKTGKLTASGAYNPMYIVRKGELIELKGDKLQLGNLEHTEYKSYTLHEFNLEKDDCVYLFTDGFPDQKGGVEGKKFYYPPFRNLLVDISDKDMKKQKDVIYNTYMDWKGDRIQLDDVCVLGIRV